MELFFSCLVFELWLLKYFGEKKIIHLQHEGLTIVMECHLVICRGPVELPKDTFQEFL